jgi:hypothetical protein
MMNKPKKPIKRRLGYNKKKRFNKKQPVLKKDYSVAQRPADILSPKEQRLIEYHALGYSPTRSERLAGYGESRNGAAAKIVLSSVNGLAYFEELMQAYRDKHFCTKEQLVRELVSRIPESSTKELVQLAQVLSKMLGLNVEKEADVKLGISIEWTTDPFVEARKENIIDVDATEIKEDDDNSN